MDLVKELIAFKIYLQNNTKLMIPFTAIDDYMEHRAINCALDETQAVRQNEQTRDICPKCKTPFHFVLGSFICPNFKCDHTK